jgi:hypothetical protein
LFRATCYSPGGGYKLSAVGHAELADNIIPKLRNLPPNAKIVVYGYTDNSPVGAALKQQGIPDNLVLSTRRAAAVANFLISQGIPADSVSAQGFGDTRPVASNDTPQVRAQNRRIEVAVTARGTPPILASRLFAGPTQYPPTDFAAYGIVAFKTRATAEDKPRYEMICNAYVAGLLHVSDVKVPVNAALARRECEASAESQGAERDRPRCGRHASSQAPVHRGGGHALMSEPVCCRLCAGGNRIRTIVPAPAKGSSGRCQSETAARKALIMLAGLRSLPSEPLEAAAIDGANRRQSFWHITLPLLRPYLLVALLLRVIFEFRAFDNIYALTGGGPANATMVLSMFTYLTSFVRFDFSLGAAASWIMLLISMVTCLFFIVTIRRREAN